MGECGERERSERQQGEAGCTPNARSDAARQSPAEFRE